MSILPLALAASLFQEPEEPKPPPQETRTPVRVGETDSPKGNKIDPPKLIKVVKPRYPPEALPALLQGAVILETVVDVQGRVAEAKVLSGDPPFSNAAVEAVKEWRYAPLKLEGTPTRFVLTVTVNFRPTVNNWSTLDFDEIISSLNSRYDAVREAAAQLLGALHRKLDSSARHVAVSELQRHLKHEDCERVRAAFTQAVAQLEVK